MPLHEFLTGAVRAGSSRQRMVRAFVSALVASAAFLSLSSEAPAAVSPPVDFVGVGDWSWPTPDRSVALSSNKVRQVRVPFQWDRVEHTQGKRDWDYADALVRYASRDGYDLILVFNGCTTWACGATRVQPRTAAQLASFLSFVDAAVRRYGADGSFWRNERWIRQTSISWQVWNEVNVGVDWTRPTAASYGAFLATTARTIKAASPSAKVVSAGLAEFPAVPEGHALVPFLRDLEAQPSFRTAADVVAVHGYATSPTGTARVLEETRAVMAAAGDTRPIWVTELGWATGGPSHPFVTSAADQARYLRETFDTLLACRTRWGVGRAYWFSYQDIAPAVLREPDYWGLHTGLLTTAGVAKPAFAEFRQYLGGRALPPGRAETCSPPPEAIDGAAEAIASAPPPSTDQEDVSYLLGDPQAMPDPSEAAVTIHDAPAVVGPNSRARVIFESNVGEGSATECSLNQQAWAPCRSPFVIPVGSENSGSLSIRVVTGTTITSAPVTTSWVVDRIPPRTIFVKSPRRVLHSRTVTAVLGIRRLKKHAGRPAETVAFQCRLGRRAWRACPSRYRGKADPKTGRQKLQVRAIDAAGNVDLGGVSATFLLTGAALRRG